MEHQLFRNPDVAAYGRQLPLLITDLRRTKIPDRPEMTIFITVYNAAAALSQSLLRIFELSTGSWELIVLLDGCYDNSLEVSLSVARAKFMQSSCMRFRVVSQQPFGIGETR